MQWREPDSPCQCPRDPSLSYTKRFPLEPIDDVNITYIVVKRPVELWPADNLHPRSGKLRLPERRLWGLGRGVNSLEFPKVFPRNSWAMDHNEILVIVILCTSGEVVRAQSDDFAIQDDDFVMHEPGFTI
jgi:hypothetical protein